MNNDAKWDSFVSMVETSFKSILSEQGSIVEVLNIHNKDLNEQRETLSNLRDSVDGINSKLSRIEMLLQSLK